MKTATIADSKIQELRKKCDDLGIDYHPRHKLTSLTRLLEDHKRTLQMSQVEQAKQDGTTGMTKVKTPRSVAHRDFSYGHQEQYVPPRSDIPDDVLEDLDYISGTTIARANRLARFIDSINVSQR